MRQQLEKRLFDYDDGDSIMGAIMAYRLDGKELVRLGLAHYDEEEHVYRKGKKEEDKT